MPEGPEVKIITEQLNELFEGQNLIDINVFGNSKLHKSIREIKRDLDLPKKRYKVVNILNKGKFIYYWLYRNNSDIFLGNNLGLTGHYSVEKHEKSIAEFRFSSDSIFYEDKRHFGKFKLFNLDELNEKLDSIGPDMLFPSIRPYNDKVLSEDRASEKTFIERIKVYPNKEIAQVIIDQNVISGIGNYLKSEILYATKIYPGTLVKNISDKKLKEMFKNAKKIIRDSYKLGGVSLRDYKDIYGNLGEYIPKVYGQDEDPKGNPVYRKQFKDKRTTYYVPKYQK